MRNIGDRERERERREHEFYISRNSFPPSICVCETDKQNKAIENLNEDFRHL